MSHLSNPLATAQQLYAKSAESSLPTELQDSILYSTAKLTQAAGVLLRLPQAIAAQAVVILYRFWLVEDLMRYEFSVSNPRPKSAVQLLTPPRMSQRPPCTSQPKSPPLHAPRAASPTSTPISSPQTRKSKVRPKTPKRTTSPKPPT